MDISSKSNNNPKQGGGLYLKWGEKSETSLQYDEN
jgi:hypothetical protein